MSVFYRVDSANSIHAKDVLENYLGNSSSSFKKMSNTLGVKPKMKYSQFHSSEVALLMLKNKEVKQQNSIKYIYYY